MRKLARLMLYEVCQPLRCVRAKKSKEIVMLSFKRSLTAAAVVAAVAASAPAQAVSIAFGGANAYQIDIDGFLSIAAGRTSSVPGYINAATNTVTGADVYLETFDAKATGTNLFGYPTRPTDSNLGEIQFVGPNGGFTTSNPNTTGSGGDLTISNGSGPGMGIRRGTAGYAAAPGGACATAPCDQTYFAYGPGQGGAMPAGVKVDFSGLLGLYGPGYQVDYLGVYYGSIDTYNQIRFYNGASLVNYGSGLLADGIVTGTEILTAMGCSDIPSCSGNQTDPLYSNVYVNISFLPSEQFTAFEFVTTGIAFEIDNVVTHIAQVPEPGSLALVGLALSGLGAVRRRKAAA